MFRHEFDFKMSSPSQINPDPNQQNTPDIGTDPADKEDSVIEPAEIEAIQSDTPPKKKKRKSGDRLGSTRGIETMFRTSYRVHMELSSLADTKANIMISINGLIISIIIASISPKIDTNPWLLIPTTVILLGCLVSIIYAVISARPRVSSNLLNLDDVRSNRANILFFGHFSKLSEDDFVTGMTELMSNSTALYQNMIRDIYGLGKVLTRKFELLRISYTIFMIGLVLGITAFIIVYVWVVVTFPDSSERMSRVMPVLESLTSRAAVA